MIKLEISGLEKLQLAAKRIGQVLSPAAIEAEVMTIAIAAGESLKAASVRACMEMIYDYPEMTYDRTMALLDAHRLRTEADGPLIFSQVVDIDPDAAAEGDVHVGREMVTDYASYVHDGYIQWVWGYDTGQFIPGREWFLYALTEAYPVVMGYIKQAFTNCIARAMHEVVA